MKNPWIRTFTGLRFYPANPKIEDIDIRDIVHGLSNTCRYNGQCEYFFSVAQHSLNCAEYAAKKHSNRLQLLCLLHDAAEAYVSDIPAPIKPLIPEFARIEDSIMRVIYEAFNIVPPSPSEYLVIKEIDKIMLETEMNHLMPFADSVDPEILFVIGAGIKIEQCCPKKIELDFLVKFKTLLHKEVSNNETEKSTRDDWGVRKTCQIDNRSN